jgi:predicted PurR-regulated permease PerM
MSLHSFEMLPEFLAGVAMAGVASLVGEILRRFVQRRNPRSQTINARVDALTKSLRDAAHLIGTIEAEVRTRSNLAEKLRADVEHYDKIKQVSAAEIEAIAQVFRGELQAEGTKSFWKGVAVNFVFFLLGAASSFLISRLTGH